MTRAHHVSIKVNETGQGEVLLDGRKVQGVRSVRFGAAVDAVTEVTLGLIATVEIDAEAFGEDITIVQAKEVEPTF